MSKRNILDLGDVTTPDFADVTVTRNDERVILKAYRQTPRCPGTVKGMVSAARREYREVTALGTEQYQPDDYAWFRLLRNLLTAAIPGLSEAEADLLSGDDERCLGILRELGWWPKADEATDDAEGEVPGEATSTTAASSPA